MLMNQRILVVEDDLQLGRQIVGHLEGAGYAPTWIKDGDTALRESPRGYVLVVLDLMLPGAYGLDVLKKMRASGSSVPVLVLSARNDTRDKVRALQLGADDFVTKPFWPDELIARVKARLRRPVMEQSGAIEAGELSIDLAARTVTVRGESVELTKVEFDLLAALARRPGAAIERSWLVENVLDPEREGTERTLDVHMSRLRKKLGPAARHVATVWGVGYRLQTQAPV
jgi:two-component system response regulator MtrA